MTLDTPTRSPDATAPLPERVAAEPRQPETAAKEVVGPRVLLVDDNAELAASLALALSEEGVLVDCAGSAETAKTVFAERRYDAVVIDLVMPGTHGMALLADLRESPQGKGVPAVLLSELPKGETRDHARRLVGKLKRAAFLDKPASPRRLLVTLGQVTAAR